MAFMASIVGLLVVIVLGLGGLGITAAVIFLLVRLVDSSKSQTYVPHGWQGTTAPGWYPDNANPAVLRYFDGNAWTSSTRPRS